MDDNRTDLEKIAMGECVSPLTVDRCPYCIDTCEASHWRRHLRETLEDSDIKSDERSY